MKAINCTQCGATIQNVSEGSLIITCDYCGARILLPKTVDSTQPTRRFQPPEFEMSVPAFSTAKIGMIAAVVLLLPILIVVFATVKRPAEPASPRLLSSTPYADPTVMPIWRTEADTSAKTVPVVNYQPRVSWDGPNDLEHFDDPQVDVSSVAHLTTEEVKKTVFKNRVAKLRVVINTEGEIDDVETISGHPILVEAATASAKRSIFRSRSKPTTRVLTYTFRVLED